jgi:hypothetical protein
MRNWMDSNRGLGSPTEWWYFMEDCPGADLWFDEDGVPIEYDALRGEGEK